MKNTIFRRAYLFSFVALLFFGATNFPLKARDPQRALKISIMWKYEGMEPTMKIYEIRSGAETGLWDTDNVEKFSETPAGKEIKNGEFLLKAGDKKEFVLVYHNPTSEAIHFFAAPHHMNPEKNSLGYKFKCLCVNHIFTAEPGRYWYRVVDLKSLATIEGDSLEISHTLVRVSDEKLKEYYETPRTSF